ncbi:MAG: hypothetical protein KBH39_09470, partial [Chitinophagales bacterium]|nr:hypothetical protein [Chitinophagales bacterium]
MKIRLALFFFLLSTIYKTNSQNQINNWFFGDSLMMHFEGGSITANQIDAPNLLPIQEASASISDADGNLLFYTDGKNVWNRNNDLMPNGCCLDIYLYWDLASSVSQGVIIIPTPGNENEYHIFILSENGCSFSKVDMTLNGGYGDIIIKNETLINNDFTEQMHAVKHANGRDWWVLIHQQRNDPDSSALFYKILLMPDTIIISTQEAGIKREGNHQGQMVFSPDGKRLAYADKNGLEIFDFDRCSGELTQTYFIPITDIAEDNLYGCAFSTDGNKLYLSTQGLSEYSQILQYCFNCNNPFEETKKMLYEVVAEFDFFREYVIGQIQNGPDDKIYFTICYGIPTYQIFTDYTMNLSSINYPNLEGNLCHIDTSVIWLGERRAIAGLPNFPNYNLGAMAGSECDTIIEVAIDNIEI